MIDLEEAIGLIEAEAGPLPPRRVRLADACGLPLAEAVLADVDSPPWDRAMMDGFAVRDADLAGGTAELDVLCDLAAGDVTSLEIRPGTAARIMTGAPLPPGADAVVPIERAIDRTAAAHAGSRVRLADSAYRPGQHVARRGTAFSAGEAVLPAGLVLAAAEIGLAAEAGATHVVTRPRPRVAILSHRERTGSAGGPARLRADPQLQRPDDRRGGEPRRRRADPDGHRG